MEPSATSAGTSTVVASSSCAWLAQGRPSWACSPSGARGDEGLQIAGQSITLQVSLQHGGGGLLALRHGICLGHSHCSNVPWVSVRRQTSRPFPKVAAPLGSAYALTGRVADAVALLSQTMEETMAMELVEFPDAL